MLNGFPFFCLRFLAVKKPRVLESERFHLQDHRRLDSHEEEGRWSDMIGVHLQFFCQFSSCEVFLFVKQNIETILENWFVYEADLFKYLREIWMFSAKEWKNTQTSLLIAVDVCSETPYLDDPRPRWDTSTPKHWKAQAGDHTCLTGIPKRC